MAAGREKRSLGTRHTLPSHRQPCPAGTATRSSAGFDKGQQRPSHSLPRQALSLHDRSLLRSCWALWAGNSPEIGHKLEKGK